MWAHLLGDTSPPPWMGQRAPGEPHGHGLTVANTIGPFSRSKSVSGPMCCRPWHGGRRCWHAASAAHPQFLCKHGAADHFGRAMCAYLAKLLVGGVCGTRGRDEERDPRNVEPRFGGGRRSVQLETRRDAWRLSRLHFARDASSQWYYTVVISAGQTRRDHPC